MQLSLTSKHHLPDRPGPVTRNIPMAFIRKGGLILAFVVLVLAACWPGQAQAWWDAKWENRLQFTLDTTETAAALTTELTEVPMLVRLHTGNFDFSKAKPDGADLRFLAADDKTVLEHRIESWDPAESMAYIWVRIPKLLANSNEQRVFMYYGNADAPPTVSGGKMYDPNFLVVYDFSESEGPPQDKTAYANTSREASMVQGIPGAIGKAVSFDGVGNRVVIPTSASLDFSQGLTFTAWVQLPQPQKDGVLLAAGEGEPLQVVVNEGGLVAAVTMKNGQVTTTAPTPIPREGWHYVAVTLSGTALKVYVDGQPAAEQTLASPGVAIKGNLALGSSVFGQRYFAGEVDEVTLAKVARDPEWIRAMFLSQGPDSGFLVVGDVEEGEAPGVFSQYSLYLGIVINNITLDGWLIILFLALMAVGSGWVMVKKSMELVKDDKANQVFIEAFEGVEGDLLDLKEDAEKYPGSTLFTVYSLGCREVEKQVNRAKSQGSASGENGSGGRRLNLVGLQKVLEIGFVRESKKLNAYLIFLTMTVAGAPFLGLLGTVWGVMSTFAGLTLAGEASLAAIAPGMASALATTVVGLLVAIPALFGYNFLVMKVKDITADMSTFIDRFVQQLEERG